MPSQYRRTAHELKPVIIARVLAGASLRALAREDGMPHPQTVRNWARADLAFGAALADALRRGPWMRLYAFDEGKAAAFLARARAGAAINSLIGSPGMPSRATYTYWQRTQPAFAEAVFALRQRRDAGIGERGRARRRAFDQGLADRIIVALHRGLPRGLLLEEVLAADPALPSRPVVTRWRRENREFDRVLRMIFAACRRRPARGWRVPDLISEEICEHIAEGGSFASYCREGGPSRTTLRRWHCTDPEFAAAVADACEWRDEWLHEQVIATAERTPPGPVAEMNRAIGPLLRHMTRLRHRPGAVHVKRKTPGSPLARG
jgi:hypothetical protein